MCVDRLLCRQIHPSCTGRNPFAKEIIFFVISIVIVIIYFLANVGLWQKGIDQLCERIPYPRPRAWLRAIAMHFADSIHTDGTASASYNTMRLLSILYAITTLSAIEMLTCYPISVTVPPGPNDSLSAKPASGQISVLASNPYQQCFAGDHAAAGVLAVLALVLHSILWPIYTAYRLYWAPYHEFKHWTKRSGESRSGHRLSSVTHRAGAQADPPRPPSGWRYFAGAVYRPRCWYFRHVNFIVLFALGIALAIERVSVAGQVAGFVLAIVTVGVVLWATRRYQPYHTDYVRE